MSLRDISFTHVIVGVGLGAADEMLERNDATSGRTETAKKWSNWLRFVALVAGYAGVATNTFSDAAGAMAQSALPLATKTAMGVVMKSGVSSPVGRYAGMRAPVAGPISRSYEPEFKTVGVY